MKPAAVAAGEPVVVAAGLLAGLPHGALDHLVPVWAGLTRGGRAMVAVLVAYATSAVLAFLVLVLLGPVGVLVVLAVSVVHFGLGDLAAAPTRIPGRLARPAAVVARGAPVVVLPLVAWPEVTDPVLATFDPRVPVMLDDRVRVALLVLLLVCAAVAAADALRRGDRRAVVEIPVLLALFTVVPPLPAFGVYFGAWHALRHSARLMETDPRNRQDLAAGRWRRPVRRFVVAAAPPTVVVLVAVAGLLLLAGRPGLLAPVLTVLLALTVPHVVVVAVLDRSTRRRLPV